MTRNRITCALSLGALLLAGCGKSSSSDTTPGLKDLAARAAKVYCGAMVKCQCTDSSAANDCETTVTKTYLEHFANEIGYQPSLKVDDTAAQKCLDDVQGELADCTGLAIPDGAYGPSGPPMPLDVGSVGSTGPSGPPPSSMPASCNSIFVGTQAEGDKCDPAYGDTDCAPGLGCNRQTHLCAQQGARGADCRYTRCVEGQFCDTYTTTCTDAIPEGKTCFYSADGFGYPECAAGLDCYYVSMYPTCERAGSQNGDWCDSNAPCAAGFYCNHYDGPNVCTALKADGVHCHSDLECVHGWCNQALTDAEGGEAPACADPGICNLDWFGGKR